MEPFPQPQATSKFEPGFATHVRHWLLAVGGQSLRQAEQASEHLDTETLADILYRAALDHGDAYINEHGGRGRISMANISAMTVSAAEYLVDSFKPAYRPRFTKAQASDGGKNSKRGPEFTLDGLEGLSISQQAKRLGCSTRTVERYRQRLRNQPDADDLLLAQLDAEIAAKVTEGLLRMQTPGSVHETDTPEPEGVHPMYTPIPEAPEGPVDSIPQTKLELSQLPDFEAMRRAEEAERAARIPQDTFLELLADPDSEPEHAFSPWPTAVENPTPDIDIEALFKDLIFHAATA